MIKLIHPWCLKMLWIIILDLWIDDIWMLQELSFLVEQCAEFPRQINRSIDINGNINDVPPRFSSGFVLRHGTLQSCLKSQSSQASKFLQEPRAVVVE